MLINVPIAIAVLIGATRVVTESKISHRSGYDVLGAVISTVGLVALVFGFSQAQASGWGSPVTLACVVAGAVLLVVFILVENRVASPLLPLRVVFEKVRGGSLLGITLGGMGTLSVWLFLTYYFQQVHGYSAVVTGLCFLPLSLAIISASTITTRLTARIGSRPLTVTGFILQVAGMVIFTQATATSSYWAIIFPGMLLRGFGFGAMFVVLSRTSLFGVAPNDAGVASAMVSTSYFVGGSIGIALLNTIAAALTASYLRSHPGGHAAQAVADVHGYTIATR